MRCDKHTYRHGFALVPDMSKYTRGECVRMTGDKRAGVMKCTKCGHSTSIPLLGVKHD